MASETKKRRLLPVALTAFALLAGVAGLAYFYFYVPEPNERDISITLNEPIQSHEGAVYTQHVFFAGRTTPATTHVELTRADSKLGEAFPDQEGNFRIGPVTLAPGLNQFELSVRMAGPSPRVTHTIYRSVSWEPQRPAPPLVNPVPATVNNDKVVVEGSAHPNAQVTLRLNKQEEQPENERMGKRAGEKAVGGAAPPEVFAAERQDRADAAGRFQIELPLQSPGKYKVVAVAFNSNRVPSEPAPEVSFTYDPNWFPPFKEPERTITRKATLLISHKRFTVNLEATLPRDDPRVVALLTNKTSIQEFVNRLYGLRFNEIGYTSEFTDVTPHITIDEKNATVRVSSDPRNTTRDILPVFGDSLRVNGAGGFPLGGSGDSLTVVVRDYTIRSLSPSPTSLNDNQATWTGKAEDASFGGINLELDYNPLSSPQNFYRLTQLSPYSFWPYPGWVVPMFINALLGVVPALWMLWLLRKYGYLGVLGEATYEVHAPYLRALLALSLITPVFSFMRGMLYLLDRLISLRLAFGIGLNNHPASFLLALLAFAVPWFLLAWLGRHGRRPRSLWLSNAAHGVGVASLLGVCLCALALEWLLLGKDLSAGRAVVFAVNAVAVLYLASRSRTTTSRLGLPAEHLKYVRWAVIGLIMLCAFPVGELVDWFDFQHAATSFFSILQDLVAYAPASIAVLLLRRTRPANRRARIFVINLGLLLFSAYLVGTTPNLFMIPIPFIISFWAFRRLVVHDRAARAALDSVSRIVIRGRRIWIQRVLASDTAQEFKNDVDKLKAKVMSGDLTPDDFEKRMKQIEVYAHKREEKTRLRNGLEAKDTVLSIGPHNENWLNGKWAIKRGSVLVLPFLAVYLVILFLRGTILYDHHYPILWTGSLVFSFLADWLLGAFFFGYFFNYIRGESGLKKGLRTSLAIILCLLPTWLNSAGTDIELVALVIRAAETFLFYTLLGVWAFDLKTFRDALGERFRWRTFKRFGDMPSFTAVASVLFGSIGVGLTTVLTGQFQELITQLIGAALGGQKPPGSL